MHSRQLLGNSCFSRCSPSWVRLLIARIIGVADTFDAITTNRPYQKAYTFQYAVETITKLTGTKFDAKVTTAFLSAYESGDIDHAAKKTVKETQSEHVSVAVNT